MKKEKQQPDVLNISSVQLCEFLKKAIPIVIEDVEMNCYYVEREIMFDYNDDVHFCGVKYDKKRAKKEKRITFSKELLSVYLDKQSFPGVIELYRYGQLDGESLADISHGIIVSSEYREAL